MTYPMRQIWLSAFGEVEFSDAFVSQAILRGHCKVRRGQHYWTHAFDDAIERMLRDAFGQWCRVRRLKSLAALQPYGLPA